MNNNLLSKLQKILKLAEAGTDGERQNAIEMAERIAAEAGLDLQVIKARNQADDAANRPEEMTEATRDEQDTDAHQYIRMLLNNYFHVKILSRKWGKNVQTFYIGAVSDVEYAKFLMDYFLGEFEQQWKSHRAAKAAMGTPLGNCSTRKAFYCGVHRTICDRLLDARRQAEAGKLQEIKQTRFQDLKREAGYEDEAELEPMVASKFEQEATQFASTVKEGYELMLVQKDQRAEQEMHRRHTKIRKARGSRGFGYGRTEALRAGRAAGSKIAIPGRPIGDRSRLG